MKHFLKAICTFALSSAILACGKKPTGDFIYSPLHPKAGEHVHFTNLSSDAKFYTWNFGDNSSQFNDDGSYVLENPSHIFLVSGIYPVSLTVSDVLKSDTKSVLVVVE